jgi:serine/threonine protein kinase
MSEKIRLLLEIATGLYHLHHCEGQAITHGDLKPENILLSDRTDKAKVRLADFGLARVRQELDKSLGTRRSTAGGAGHRRYGDPEFS